MYLAGVNCIYDDGSVISMDQGPCQDPLPSGATLVDSNISESSITVTTEPPGSGLGLLFILGLGFLFLGGRHVSR